LTRRIERLKAGQSKAGFIGAMDALHLALAIKGGCEVLLTTDDAFLERAHKLDPIPEIRVENPARWLVVVIEL